MGCAASAEGPQPNMAGRQEDSTARHDTNKQSDATPPATTQQANNDPPAVAPQRPAPQDSNNPTPSVVTTVTPATIAGYPVNTYTDGTTRVAVKCVILSRQKCDSVCRFLDSVRKARDRNGGYFRNPEEPIEVEPRRDVETGSAASNRSKLEPSMSNVPHNSSVTGHGMNVSMAVHVGQSEALSPSPHGNLAHIPDTNSATTPAKAGNPDRARERAPLSGNQSPQIDRPDKKGNEPEVEVVDTNMNRQQDGEPIPGSVDVDGAL